VLRHEIGQVRFLSLSIFWWPNTSSISPSQLQPHKLQSICIMCQVWRIPCKFHFLKFLMIVFLVFLCASMMIINP
jgi:hypothetical protein